MSADRLEPGAFLCERCGYALDGIVAAEPGGRMGPRDLAASACPECGAAAADSMPEHRTGSPWQRRPGPASLVATWLWVLRRPTRCWREVAVHAPGTGALGVATQLVAGIVLALGLGLPRGTVRAWTGNAGEAAGVLALAGLVAGGCFVLLSLVEQFGIRFIGRRRGWRVTRAVSTAVTAHASVGWIVGAGVLAAGFHWAWSLALDTRPSSPPVERWLPVVAAGGAWLVALLAFEGLVYAGTRRMRFANRAGAGPARASGPSDRDASRPSG